MRSCDYNVTKYVFKNNCMLQSSKTLQILKKNFRPCKLMYYYNKNQQVKANVLD